MEVLRSPDLGITLTTPLTLLGRTERERENNFLNNQDKKRPTAGAENCPGPRKREDEDDEDEVPVRLVQPLLVVESGDSRGQGGVQGEVQGGVPGGVEERKRRSEYVVGGWVGGTRRTPSSSGVSSRSGSYEDLTTAGSDSQSQSQGKQVQPSSASLPSLHHLPLDSSDSDEEESLLGQEEDKSSRGGILNTTRHHLNNRNQTLTDRGQDHIHRVQDYDYEEQSGSFLRKSIPINHIKTTSGPTSTTEGDTDESEMDRPKKVYKVVLTGGPCGGKTTGQARLCTFFENLGWKVFRVPEAANILLGGGIKFSELTEAQAFKFQEQLLRTMMQVESVFFTMAESVKEDVLIICDRGAMDAAAFIPRGKWEEILRLTELNEVDIRDSRYNQIIHMVSAANGAEPFYTLEDHASRSECLELARELDTKAAQAWVGHPYFDVVDNSTDFETKVCRMIQCVCQKLGIDVRDRLQTNAKKVKFLVKGPLPPTDVFPPGFQDFAVVHDYLQTSGPKMQARLRKRGQKGHWSYTYTVRRPELQGQVIEVKTALTQRDYYNMLSQKDENHVTVFKTRRCILLNDQYFQLDVYKDPCHPRCKGLILLETYSTLTGEELQQRLPKFLEIVKEVTGDPRNSMFNLSLKERWADNAHFCQSLAGTELGGESRNSKYKTNTNENGLAGY